MSKNSSAKYYQNNKRKATKKRSRNMPKKKNDNMVVSDTKTYRRMKNKSLFRIEKYIIK